MAEINQFCWISSKKTDTCMKFLAFYFGKIPPLFPIPCFQGLFLTFWILSNKKMHCSNERNYLEECSKLAMYSTITTYSRSSQNQNIILVLHIQNLTMPFYPISHTKVKSNMSYKHSLFEYLFCKRIEQRYKTKL
jgi:hypothetical protein